MTTDIFNHLWQSTVFAGVVALLSLALRRNRARLRYGIWFVASVKFLVPFAALAAAGSLLWKAGACAHRVCRDVAGGPCTPGHHSRSCHSTALQW